MYIYILKLQFDNLILILNVPYYHYLRQCNPDSKLIESFVEQLIHLQMINKSVQMNKPFYK